MNKGLLLARFRTHFFRVAPIMSYGITILNYLMLVFMSVKTGSTWVLYTIPFVFVGFAALWYVDDKNDLIGTELTYSFFRSHPLADMLIKLDRLDPKRITPEERRAFIEKYNFR